MKKISTILFTFLVLSNVMFAQSAKQHIKTGDQFKEAQKYDDAVQSYTKALDIEPKSITAFTKRAETYETLNNFDKAVEDYEKAIVFDADNTELYFKAGKVYVKLHKPDKAIELFSKAINIDVKYLDAYHQRAQIYFAIGDHYKAIEDYNKILYYDNDDFSSYYKRAVVADSLGFLQKAEVDYEKAIDIVSSSDIRKYKHFYVSLIYNKVNLNKTDEAIKLSEKLLKIDNNYSIGYYAKGLAYAKKEQHEQAVNNFSKAISIDQNFENAFYQRGLVFKKLGQFQNAIADFTKSIILNDKNLYAFYYKAQCLEELGNKLEAAKDFEKFLKLTPKDEKEEKILADVSLKLLNLYKESDKPSVQLIYPEVENNMAKVPAGAKEILLKGNVNDASKIKSVFVNNIAANYDSNKLNPEFSVPLTFTEKDNIVINATDIYDNTTTLNYKINRTESESPVVTLLSPEIISEKEIYVDSENPILYIEGQLRDLSLIKSVIVNGLSANFSVKNINPIFSVQIDITNKDKVDIEVTDVHNNKTNLAFTLNREGVALSTLSPMGKTWVLFLENSEYQYFQSLEGPYKDVTLMKTALANYRIDKVIHKKNMTKLEMEKFFSIELRDLLKTNKVNSLLVWYAGHGKFINETGYWIPVDALKDDEFSFYNINNIKASVHAYTNVRHLLIVSDACESGPAFYLAMRDGTAPKQCGDWESTKFKSVQVFTSSSEENAADVSLFTKTFARALTYNPDECISIEKIVDKVTQSVKENTTQKPKFGKISGLDDQNGTFFFLKNQ